MIKYISIRNFKSIKKIGMGLGSLNLLFGMNGMGKSSTIQSLLLCRQSYWRNGKLNMDKLYPSGDLTVLGTVRDVFCMHSDNNILELYIKSDKGEFDFKYEYDYLNNFAPNFRLSEENCEGLYEESAVFNDKFTYISADHIGPQRKYDFSEWNDNHLNRLGNRGEFAIPFLAMNGNKYQVPEELCLNEGRTIFLIDQVTAWMGRISPGVRLDTELLMSDQEARLLISYEEGNMVSDKYLPYNIGFGIPYVLPIVVALLSADKGSIVLIENPESHLHPKGQSAIAELLARAASYGIQIICESHSDHIINGVRVAIKNQQINSNEVEIFYYGKNINQDTEVTQIEVDSFGNLSSYPTGLLDEWGNLMSKLL